MSRKKTICIFLISFLFITCDQDNDITGRNRFNLVEGTWKGMLNQSDLVITFIEGEFESAITLSGSAFLNSDSLAGSYLILGGAILRQDSVQFSLINTSSENTAEYHLRGGVRHDTLSGTYIKIDKTDQASANGPWTVIRIP